MSLLVCCQSVVVWLQWLCKCGYVATGNVLVVRVICNVGVHCGNRYFVWLE